MGHQWLGFEPARLLDWLAAAGLEAARVLPLPPDPEAQGPNLFTARAVAPSDLASKPNLDHTLSDHPTEQEMHP